MDTNNEVERLRAICEESQAALARLDPLMSEVRRPTQLNTTPVTTPLLGIIPT